MARLIMNPCLESVLIMLLTPREKEEKKIRKRGERCRRAESLPFVGSFKTRSQASWELKTLALYTQIRPPSCHAALYMHSLNP
jgi:hypothetical protein